MPVLAVAIWLVFVGTALWQHIKTTDTPPSYDPLSYIEKAKNFWENVRAREIRAVLRVQPSWDAQAAAESCTVWVMSIAICSAGAEPPGRSMIYARHLC